MEELIVEGLSTEDFILLEKLIRTYPTTLDSDISYQNITSLYSKIKQITDYLEE